MRPLPTGSTAKSFLVADNRFRVRNGRFMGCCRGLSGRNLRIDSPLHLLPPGDRLAGEKFCTGLFGSRKWGRGRAPVAEGMF